MTNRKFFSGNSVRQAVVSAASYFDLSPDEIAYREVDKKHGFLKLRKRVIIEVDADDPGRPPLEIPAMERNPDQPARRGETMPRGESHGDAAGALSRSPDRRARGEKPPMPDVEDEEGDDDGGDDEGQEKQEKQEKREGSGRRGGGRGSRRGSDRSRGDRSGEGRSGDDRSGDDRKSRDAGGAEEGKPGKAQRQEKASEGEGGGRGRSRGRGRGRGRGQGDGDLVELREESRSPRERYREARGQLADACRTGLDRILDLVGIEVEYKVFEGEDRFEVELSGPDEELLVAEDGDLLRAIEHLLPRAMRGVAGDSMLVRVNCRDFHEIHEERLRNLAQEAAAQVRRQERPMRLDPMSPADRRIVHVTLADEPGVTSSSDGSGHYKQIVVRPI